MIFKLVFVLYTILMITIEFAKAFSCRTSSMCKAKLCQALSMSTITETITTYSGLVIERCGDKLLVELGDSSRQDQLIVCSQKKSLSGIGIVVGDKVKVEIDEIYKKGVVVDYMKRVNILARPPPRTAGRHKIDIKPIASNIDQIVIVTAPKPKVSLLTIDQLIAAAEAIRVSNIAILINKCDLPNIKEFENEYCFYKDLGYDVLKTSVESSTGIEELNIFLANKTSIFVGQSGVGKSSLTNCLIPEANARVGELTFKVEAGAHTTSNARLYHMKNGGRLIDSPGIREFGLWQYNDATIHGGFKEIFQHSKKCRFSDCKHDEKSKDCAVRDAVNRGIIQLSRLTNFRKIMNLAYGT